MLYMYAADIMTTCSSDSCHLVEADDSVQLQLAAHVITLR